MNKLKRFRSSFHDYRLMTTNSLLADFFCILNLICFSLTPHPPHPPPPPPNTHTHTSSSFHCSHSLQLPGPLLTLCANPDSPHFAAVQLTDGTVLKYVSHESGGTASDGCSLKVGEAGELSGQPSLVPWCLHDGRKVTFPDTCCEHVAMATFKDEVFNK